MGRLMLNDNNYKNSDGDNNEKPSSIAEDITNIVKRTDQENTSNRQNNAPDRSIPSSRADIVQQLIKRIDKMSSNYTLGLETTQSMVYENLQYLNDNFFFDRPVSETEFNSPNSGVLKATFKKKLFPILKSTLNILLERQRIFNSELVKLLNGLVEVLGNQRDFNLDVIQSCERIIEHYRLLETIERRFDDYYVYATRLAVAEEEIELLSNRVAILEKSNVDNESVNKPDTSNSDQNLVE